MPGLLCDEVLWRQQADALADIADPVIADLTLDDSIAAMAERTLASSPERFALAALSMGGYVAFEILRQAPQRVTRLALLDTSAAPDDDIRTKQRIAGIASLQAGKFSGVTNRLLPQLVHASHVTGPVGEVVKSMAQRVGDAAFLRQQTAILRRRDSRPLLHEISVPALVAVGDSDRLTPVADAVEIHRAIAAAKLHIFRQCGHLPPLESPEETNEVLREWLRECATP
ncbi:pimeloyl-ACP methyl ester carboxylesterase [Povalibacter uvarum]|uniref:Pimeloyl-ACP methyl ester carboxylesterase n=1 Tax=Povalibacter uvarum TaxID=732238 RepID=A0A841HLE5_9GAMM|nr:alpha/beta hydrolase [Povalibacter uvarum]MBB6093897.1 pimeloyl-ACP methyl ester carboxylesterase [Povalibacter uvarum]